MSSVDGGVGVGLSLNVYIYRAASHVGLGFVTRAENPRCPRRVRPHILSTNNP